MVRKITGALITVLAFAIGAHAQQTGNAGVDMRFRAANEYLSKKNLTITTSPDQAFINDYVLVYAEGLPSKEAKSVTQKRATATRAAEVLAYRQLTEFLEGVAVVGETTVQNLELQYDVVKVAVTGVVKGAIKVYSEYNEKDESAIVILKLGMTGPKGFGHTMYEKLFGDPKMKKEVVDAKPLPEYKAVPEQKLEGKQEKKMLMAEEKYDGLIIDATAQSFKPALINRILTGKGEVIYDPSKVSQKVLVEHGCGEYTNSMDKAKAALGTRGVKNPLVIKANGTGSSSADLAVTDDDAVRIFSANQKGVFLAGAKVAFVLK